MLNKMLLAAGVALSSITSAAAVPVALDFSFTGTTTEFGIGVDRISEVTGTFYGLDDELTYDQQATSLDLAYVQRYSNGDVYFRVTFTNATPAASLTLADHVFLFDAPNSLEFAFLSVAFRPSVLCDLLPTLWCHRNLPPVI